MNFLLYIINRLFVLIDSGYSLFECKSRTPIYKIIWDLISLIFFFHKFKKKATFEFIETSKYEEGFSEYYKENLLPLSEEFNKIRLAALKKVQRHTYFIFIPTIIIEYMIFKFYGEKIVTNNFYMLALITTFLVVLSYTLEPILNYQNLIKSKIFMKIVSFFGDYAYFLKGVNKSYFYNHFDILPSYHVEDCDDFFTGTHKGVKLTMYETHLMTEHYSRVGIIRKTVFKGIVIVLNVNKPFVHKTIIDSDTGTIRNWLKKCRYNKALTQKIRLNKVSLESSVFEKVFEVLSEDQIEARYLLTTSFMDRLLKLHEYFGKEKIKASFCKKQLLITIPCKRNMFEPGSILNEEDFVDDAHKFIKEMSLIFEVIDTLKLDQDIGM